MMNTNCIGHKEYSIPYFGTDKGHAMLDTSVVENGVVETAIKLYNIWNGGSDWFIVNRTHDIEHARKVFESWDEHFSVNPLDAANKVRVKYHCDCTTF